MRIGALYDIHGNLPALEAVLAEVRRENVERVIVGGDIVPGPMPRETLACLLELEIPTQFIQGNGEVAVLAEMAGEKSAVPEPYRPAIQWVGQQFGAGEAQLFASWPKTLTVVSPALGEILVCHATPRNENEIFTRATAEERVAPAFADVTAPLVICGHTHMQFDRTIGRARVVNAGSVGMPFGEPGAYWLLLDDGGVHLRRTDYDLERATDRIRQTQYPGAEQFAANDLLHPRAEREMIELFGKAELR